MARATRCGCSAGRVTRRVAARGWLDWRFRSENGVDAAHLVDHLCDPEVDVNAGQREGVSTGKVVLALEQCEHRLKRDERRLVKLLVQTEGDPADGGARDRGGDRQVLA